jgi:hypothetical protein
MYRPSCLLLLDCVGALQCTNTVLQKTKQKRKHTTQDFEQSGIYGLTCRTFQNVTVLNQHTLRNRTPDDGLGQSEACRE